MNQGDNKKYVDVQPDFNSSSKEEGDCPPRMKETLIVICMHVERVNQ